MPWKIVNGGNVDMRVGVEERMAFAKPVATCRFDGVVSHVDKGNRGKGQRGWIDSEGGVLGDGWRSSGVRINSCHEIVKERGREKEHVLGPVAVEPVNSVTAARGGGRRIKEKMRCPLGKRVSDMHWRNGWHG